MFTIIKKELKSYFLSSIGYIFIGLFLLMLSIFFYVDIYLYSSTNFENMFYSGSTILTFTIPLITVKLFAKEEKNGSDVLLFNSPKNTTKIVLSKFFSSVIVVMVLEVLTVIYMGILMYFGNPHFSTAILTLIGFLLLAMAYISCGMFISSITESKVISSILTIIVFIIIWVAPNFYNIFENYSLINSFTETFLQGILSFKSVILLLSFTLFFILLTILKLSKINIHKIAKKINENNTKNKIKYNIIINSTIVVIMILVFIGVNYGVRKLNINSLDFTKEKLYTLSEGSKELIKNVDNTVNVYFFGFAEDESTVVLAKQYNQVNERITAEAIDITQRPDLATKYGVESEDTGIIVQGPDRYKVLTYQDLHTYDYTAYRYLDISEQKLTNAILDVTMKNKPNIYFITGHEEFDINTYGEMYTLNMYLQNDVNNVNTLNLLTSDFPENCDLIVITSPKKDYDSQEVDILMNYINNGGNILWLNDSTFIEGGLSNIEKVLDYYGVKIGTGVVLEENTSNMINQSPYLILPEISNHKVTEDFYTNNNIVFAQATKLETKNDDELYNSNITINKILSSTGTSAYFNDVTNINSFESGPFILGLESIKQIDENKSSKLIIYSDNFFITDSSITIGSNKYALVNLYNNLDLVLNSVAYLTNREDAIVIRKDTGNITIIPTKQQDLVVKTIIFVIPILIILFGIIVWQIRKRK